MNLEDLTLREIKDISSLLSNGNCKSEKQLIDYTGQYVIVRSRNEGINAGIVKAHDSTGIILSEARRIWYHKPKDKTTSWYEGVSLSGLSDDSKISAAVIEKAIIEDYSITVCSATSQKSIVGHKTTETSC